MTTIKTANERCEDTAMLSHHNACMREITDLRTALAERDAEIAEANRNLGAECTANKMLRAAAQQALEALDMNTSTLDCRCVSYRVTSEAITALTAALKGTP